MYEDMLNDLRNVVELRNVEFLGTIVITLKEINMLKAFPNETGVQREKSKKHVKDIKESMLERFIPPVIKVNKRGYILDGQHTVQAAKELLEEGKISANNEMIILRFDTKGTEGDRNMCRILNTLNKGWTKGDFLTTEANSGKEDYIWFKNFQEETGFSTLLILELVTGKTSGGTNNSKRIDSFKEGNFVATQSERLIAQKIAGQIYDLKEFIPRNVYKSDNFRKAFAKIARNKEYNHKKMLSKLEYQSDRIKKKTSKYAYMEMLEDIYNYRNRKKVELFDKRK